MVCWGSDTDGESSAAVGVFTQVELGNAHSCGLREEGTPSCWGNGGVEPAPPEQMLSVSAGDRVSCGVMADDRSVNCWGDPIGDGGGGGEPPPFAGL